jgi:hypothetical protein
LKEFRCTRNALYSHDCTGRDDIRERQGHYIWAINEEAAWQEMARRYPEETTDGFTVEPWFGGGNTAVMEVCDGGTKRPAGLIAALKEVQAMGKCNMLDANCVIAVLNNLGYKTVADWLGENLDRYIDIIDELLK